MINTFSFDTLNMRHLARLVGVRAMSVRFAGAHAISIRAVTVSRTLHNTLIAGEYYGSAYVAPRVGMAFALILAQTATRAENPAVLSQGEFGWQAGR